MKIKVFKHNFIFVYLVIYFTGKILWDRLIPAIAELLSVGVLAVGVFMFFAFSKGIFRMRLIVYCGLFSLYLIVNALLQDTRQQMVRAIYEYCFYLLMFLGMSYYMEKVDIGRCCNIWGVLISLLSWFEYLTKSYILPNNFTVTIRNAYGFRATVFTRSYLSHGMVLAFFVFIALYLFIKTGQKRYFISAIFNFISIVTTSSRGPLVAAAAGLFVFFLLNEYRKKLRKDKKIFIVFLVFLAGIIGFTFLKSSFVTGNETIDYFLYRTRQIINWTGDPGNVGRLEKWNEALDYFKSNILFGIGPSHTGSWGTGSIGVTESGYLKHLCELGIIGFGLLYIFVISIIRSGVKKYKRMDNEMKKEMILFFSIIVLVMVNNIAVQSTEEIMVNFIWAVGMGGIIPDYKKCLEADGQIGFLENTGKYCEKAKA